MKDVNNIFREAVYAALNGAIVYAGSVVNVFTGIADTTDNLYIVLSTMSDSQVSRNKKKFCTASTLVIDIVHHQTRAVSFSAVSDVYGQVMELLVPSPQTAGFNVPVGFQVTQIEVAGTEDLFEQTVDKVVRKIARLRAEIFDNS
jgi:hypothetical protein